VIEISGEDRDTHEEEATGHVRALVAVLIVHPRAHDRVLALVVTGLFRFSFHLVLFPIEISQATL